MKLKSIKYYKSCINRLKGKKIAIVGDIILDKYERGTVNRISPEAPVPVIHVKEETYKLGAAANVAANIRSIGAKPILIGVVGKDKEARIIRGLLQDAGISTRFLLTDGTRDTSLKIRIIAHSQQIARLDYEKTHPVSRNIIKTILKYINSEKPHGVIVQDYAKGMINELLLRKLLGSFKGKIIVDPHPTRHFSLYTGVYSITPNRNETLKLTGSVNDTNILSIAKKLYSNANVKQLLVTLGNDGMLLLDRKQIYKISSLKKEVFDITGAGDVVISIYASLQFAGVSSLDSAVIANIGGAITVTRIGTAVVNKKELFTEMKFIKEVQISKIK